MSMIGTTVSHYRILEQIGRGGMGEVWKAQDTRLDRFVALKFVPEAVAQDRAMVERFLREARAASALNHPHICTIHDIGEWEGRRFIVMELLEGATLAERAAASPLDVETLIEVGIQLADALDAAHGKNIIHRDIKANNIILSPRGQAKILDFGLAKITAPGSAKPGEEDQTVGMERDLTDAGHAVGTIGYMSPEQALGREVDGRTDIFSLGVVLYEMATGRRPFPGSTSAAVFDAILNKAPVAPVSLNPGIPAELARIINKTLEKDRTLRYQTAADLTTDLKRLRRDSGSQVSVAAARAASPPRRWLPIAAAAIVVVAGSAIWWMAHRGGAPAGPVASKPLTSLVGVEAGACWSPDGGFLAYSHSESGPEDIYVVSVNGGEPIRLVASEADDSWPRWSPDNRWIAFASGRGGTKAIYLIPPLGGTEQKLVDLEESPLYGASGMGAQPWSPDGRFFLFDRVDSTGRRAIWKMNLDTREVTRLSTPPEAASDRAASWSFDGKQIAFGRVLPAGSSLLVMPAAGGAPREILTSKDSNGWPAWSPDSRQLVFESNRTGNIDLWIVDARGGRPRQLTSGTGDETSPSVSRSGRILYSTFSHQTDLYVQDVASGDARRLTSHTHDNFVARYAPDGNHLAYTSSRTGAPQVWVIDTGSGSERQITSAESENSGATWSPDGRRLAFISNRDGSQEVWVCDADGAALRKLSDAVVHDDIKWAPDGAGIGITTTGLATMRSGASPNQEATESASLALVPLDGGPARELFRGLREFDWYLDSKRIVASVRTSSGPELRAIRLDTGEHVVLTREPVGEPRMNRDGSALTFLSATSHYNMNLFVQRLVPPSTPGGLPRPAGPPLQITHGDGQWHVHNGDWSPDGREVVYTRDTDSGDVFVLDGVFKGR